MKTHYETLEVSTRASHGVIRAAYRCLVQHHHPDKNPDVVDAGHRLTSINRAYSVLSDPLKRQAYDLHQGIARAFVERRGQGPFSPAQREPQAERQATSRPFGFRVLV
jgi:molecular chaperone DnaJ